MEFVVFTEPQQGFSYDDQRASAEAAERLGFDAWFRSDHYMRMGAGDPLRGLDDAVGRQRERALDGRARRVDRDDPVHPVDRGRERDPEVVVGEPRHARPGPPSPKSLGPSVSRGPD